MATRTEDRLGPATNVCPIGSTYTNIGTVAASTTWNLHITLTNMAATTIKVRGFVADSTWASGAPSGTTLVAPVCYDLLLNPGDVVHLTGNVIKAGEKLIFYSDTAASLGIEAGGVKIV